ncbi:hypothetical protein Pmani_017841 [Petrolisthes manimaculis]|uniref:Uncharacterized protein n=1 Tax=Petrolisthes manimaculis TaxID=1843537 RepID=A0AAE1PNN6_9EUCA|nr:hypothetical protein Pmani_017841 [Petrolisthes manimaculis]
MAYLCRQPETLDAIPRLQKWFVFVIGMLETMLWSGVIFGWASLTYPSCPAQDERFALLYTVACVVYTTPGILVGYGLHHLGLAFTRVMGDYLWGAIILLSVGGNTVRMAGLQFANLFPSARNTAMAIISGIFTPSAGVLMVLQSLYEYGVEWHYCCWVFASASSLMIIFTPLVPRHHIPYTQHKEKEVDLSNTKDQHQQEQPSIKIRSSVFSLSSLLNAYWLFINLFGVTIFATHFNAWINKFATSTEESKTGLSAEIASLQAMIIPMVVVSVTAFAQTAMLLFSFTLGCLCGTRGSDYQQAILSRGRQPLRQSKVSRRALQPSDWNTGISSVCVDLLQYPHFTWAQDYYYLTFGVTLGAMSVSLTPPSSPSK